MKREESSVWTGNVLDFPRDPLLHHLCQQLNIMSHSPLTLHSGTPTDDLLFCMICIFKRKLSVSCLSGMSCEIRHVFQQSEHCHDDDERLF